MVQHAVCQSGDDTYMHSKYFPNNKKAKHLSRLQINTDCQKTQSSLSPKTCSANNFTIMCCSKSRKTIAQLSRVLCEDSVYSSEIVSRCQCFLFFCRSRSEVTAKGYAIFSLTAMED